jgi:hypothetical protein
VATQRDLQRLQEAWAEDVGAYRDLIVENTTIDDWQRVIDAVRALEWPSTYSEDGVDSAMPADAATTLARARERSCLWQLRADHTFRINCHFFGANWIEFDIDPSEIHSPSQLNFVYLLLRTVGSALNRPVSFRCEGSPPGERHLPDDLRFDPTTDAIVLFPDP